MDQRKGKTEEILEEAISINGVGSDLAIKMYFDRTKGNGWYTFKKSQRQVDITFDSTNEVIRATTKKMMKQADQWLSEKRHEWLQANPQDHDPNQTSFLDEESENGSENQAAIQEEKPKRKRRSRKKKEEAETV